MPTAHDYRHAATQLRSEAERIAGERSVLRSTTVIGHIAGGTVATVLEQRLDTVRTELDRARSELDRLATICEHRATICAAYAADLQRHRLLATTADAWSSPPPVPAWWVTT